MPKNPFLNRYDSLCEVHERLMSEFPNEREESLTDVPTPSGMPPRPDNAARTHRPRGPSGVARGCEALLYPEKRRVFRMILAHYLLRVDGKREIYYQE
jgi:hypothetical protein